MGVLAGSIPLPALPRQQSWPRSRKCGWAAVALADGEGRGDPGAGVRGDAECSWAGSVRHLCFCIVASSPKRRTDREEPGWGGGTLQLPKILWLTRFGAREGAWEGSSRRTVPKAGSGELVSASPSLPTAQGSAVSPWGHTGPLHPTAHCGHPSWDVAGPHCGNSSPGWQKPS